MGILSKWRSRYFYIPADQNGYQTGEPSYPLKPTRTLVQLDETVFVQNQKFNSFLSNKNVDGLDYRNGIDISVVSEESLCTLERPDVP